MFRPALALFLAVSGAAIAPHPLAAEEFEEHLTLDDNALRLANVVGEIRVERTDDPAYHVDVRVRGKDASHDVQVVSHRTNAGTEVRIEFPLDRETHYVYPELGRSKTTFQPHTDGGGWFKLLLSAVTGNRITVSGEGPGREVWADVVIHMPRNASLELRHGVGPVFADQISGTLNLHSQAGPMTVTSIEGRLAVDTGSGAVEGSALRGDVDIDTGSGGVVLRDVEGSIHVDTGSGRVELESCRGERMAVDTGSGRVTLAGIAYGELSVDTGSGSIDLDLVAPVSAEIAASTGSGGIDLDLEDVRVLRDDRHDKKIEAGSGDAKITLDTGAGSIRVTANAGSGSSSSTGS